MSKGKILIIEDELQMRYLLRTHLDQYFEIDTIKTAVTKTKLKAQEKNFQIIVEGEKLFR